LAITNYLSGALRRSPPFHIANASHTGKVAKYQGLARPFAFCRQPASAQDLADRRNRATTAERGDHEVAGLGHAKTDMMRKIIVGVIEQYAQRTQNWHLLRLMDRFTGFCADRPDPSRKPPPPPKPAKPTYPLDEQDYRSIVDVLEKHGRSVSMAVLGKVRRRWLERPPRDPGSCQPNRLADVLTRMVEDGVLCRQGTRYVPGPRYRMYLAKPEPAAVA